MTYTAKVEAPEFQAKLEHARTPLEVQRLIHIDLPQVPGQAAQQMLMLAYGKLEAVAVTGEEGCTGGRGVVRVEEMK